MQHQQGKQSSSNLSCPQDHVDMLHDTLKHRMNAHATRQGIHSYKSGECFFCICLVALLSLENKIDHHYSMAFLISRYGDSSRMRAKRDM